MTEQKIVIAIFLPVGETRRAIATRGAGSEIARPQLGEFQTIFPADHSRLAGELAKLRRVGCSVIRAGAFRHCVANFKMKHDSNRCE